MAEQTPLSFPVRHDTTLMGSISVKAALCTLEQKFQKLPKFNLMSAGDIKSNSGFKLKEASSKAAANRISAADNKVPGFLTRLEAG